MKKAIIYVFSATGNTLKACNLFKEQFEKNEIETEIVKITIDTEPVEDFTEYDYVGIGYPVHGFNAPYNVLDFAKKIKKQNANVNYFVVKTGGEPLHVNDVSSYKLDSILRKKGFKLTNEYHYAMPYNMIFRHTDARAVQMHKTIEGLAPIEAQEVVDGIPHRYRYHFFGHTFAFILRIEHPAMKFNGKVFFKVDQEKCIHCGLCVKNCSVHNITMNEDGSFTFGNKCIMCTACSFNCPKDAFNIGMLQGWKVNGKYNINNPDMNQEDKHSRYCKKSYARYFKEAEEKIASHNAK